MGLIDDIQDGIGQLREMRDEARAEMNRLLPEFRALRDDFQKTRATIEKLTKAVTENTKIIKASR